LSKTTQIGAISQIDNLYARNCEEMRVSPYLVEQMEEKYKCICAGEKC
jgi:hypothetical protein